MILMMMTKIIINWLRVWRIGLQVTNTLVTAFPYSKLPLFKEQSVDLILIWLLGHERYAVLSDIINKYK